MNGNQEVREAARKEQLQWYVRQHDMKIRFYQDYSWPAVALEEGWWLRTLLLFLIKTDYEKEFFILRFSIAVCSGTMSMGTSADAFHRVGTVYYDTEQPNGL